MEKLLENIMNIKEKELKEGYLKQNKAILLMLI
jgi:hypothetical protein